MGETTNIKVCGEGLGGVGGEKNPYQNILLETNCIKSNKKVQSG